MSTTSTASQRITDTVTSWPDVEAGPGRRGEFAFTVGGRQIGHLHGDRAAHFSFPPDVWAQLREQGRGIGSRILAEHCSRLDEERQIGYLETDKAENVVLYERFGYRVHGEAEIIGVRNWFMLRGRAHT